MERENCNGLVNELLTAAENNDVSRVKALLGENISLINAQDADGYTSLHRASYNNHVDVVKVLLSKGADVDIKTRDGWQPLHSACRWNSTATVEVLVKDGADVNARTKGGQTPLHLAASNPNARETLKVLLALPHIELNPHNACKDTPREIAIRCGPNADLFEYVS